MAKNLKELLASLPKKEQKAIDQKAKVLIAEEMSLQKLRKARARSQQKVGKILHVNQAAVSKLERRADMYVSTLKSYVQAMGGQLEIIATFPDRTAIKINQFEEL